MSSERQIKPAALSKIETLAKELSSSVRLSFSETSVGAFHGDAKALMARTRRIYQTLVANLTEYARGTPGIETLLDNSHMIAGTLAILGDHWRRKETLRLPQIADEDGNKRPRAYIVARALAREADVRIDRQSVTAFLKAYQRQAPLSVRELDIFPDMLRFALVEELVHAMDATRSTFLEIDEAERWLGRMSAVVGRRNAESELAALANQLAREHKVVPVHFGYHLLQRIAQSGQERDLRVVSRRLKVSLSRQGVGASRLPEIIAKGERGQAMVIDRIVAGLHWLSQMRWDKLSLQLNAVDAVLERDPAGVYAELTDESKSSYRRAIVRIADRTGAHDVEVAREAQRLARAARTDGKGGSKERLSHVGYYLVGPGLAVLEQAFHYQPGWFERFRGAVLRRAAAAYLGLVFVVTVALAVSFVPLLSGGRALPAWAFAVLGIAGLVLASEIGVAVAHLVFTRLIPPRPMPQIDCQDGIGATRRTVVVVPSFFRDARSTEKLLSRLETNFVANQDPDVFFSVLLDFADAPEERADDDDAERQAAEDGIARLNAAYPSAIPRFTLFFRKRVWNPREGSFMGWERKRGKLWEFNRLLRGKPTTYAGDAAEAAARFGHVRYVLTVDEDAELSRDCVRALVGTIDHPLNRPSIDPVRRVVTDGYGIVMPRSALRFEEGAASAFARIFGGFPGIEPYSSFVSDLHQDLFGDAIYQGKGIYDIDAFEATMEGRIPENTVLSHDLLEGLYARAGMASNAHIFEGFPTTYRSHVTRVHRWIRGDWQIVRWLLTERGGIFPLIGRWRILDNLRRSLLPIALVIAVTSAMFSPASALFWSIFAVSSIGAGQLLPSLARALSLATSPNLRFTIGYRIKRSLVDLAASAVKTLLIAMFSLQNAFVAADAVWRSLWRQLISKRKLLEWQTAYEASATGDGLLADLASMWPSATAALVLIVASAVLGTVVDPVAFVWSVLWVAAPAAGTLISLPSPKARPLARRDSFFLRGLAARTFWFFTDMVTRKTHWLPPDHFQEEPASKRHSHGLGVSPTNLGMYLLSLSASRKLGLITVTHFASRVGNAIASMGQLERFRGHFFNWYELRALKPIHPWYVSSVDSANLALVLLALKNALVEACREPLVSKATFEGFDAGLSVLAGISSRMLAAHKNDPTKRKLLRETVDAVSQSRRLVKKALAAEITPRSAEQMSSGAVHHAVRIRNAMEALRLEEGSEAFEELFLSARHIEELAIENRDLVGQYLGFAIVPTIASTAVDKDLRSAYARLNDVLVRIPGLNGLSEGGMRRNIEQTGFADAVDRSALPPQEKDIARAWYGEINSRLSVAEDRARAVRAKLLSSSEAARRYYDDMDFAFLYDEERGLFHMGYNATRQSFDEIFYDLFASEANSASIVGISKNHAPKEHWAHLGRKLVRSAAGAATPVSWAGSLFEYLGTLLYFDIPERSFWGVSARRAVASHRRFGRKMGIPWGMGESASSSTDASGNFHYQAFGEPSIGFKRNLSESVVVAPYTTALSLSLVPRHALTNFRQLARAGALGRYGFYDAIDYTAYSMGEAVAGVPVPIYYAHHQGFILCSIANAILDGWARRMVAAEPDMRAISQLFEEKMPIVPPVEPLGGIVRQKTPFGRARDVKAEPRHRYVSARPKEAQWNYLSNGAYRIAISSTGAGDSRYGDIDITRPNDEPMPEAVGTYFYLYDRERKALWSPTHMPTRTHGERASVSFGSQAAVFNKSFEGIASALTVAVDPRAPVEVRELTVTNRRSTPVSLTIGACAEVTLTKRRESLIHRNFHDLFLASGPALDGSAMAITRSDARDGDRSAAAVFLVAAPEGRPADLRLTRDRETFFGPIVDRAEPLILRDPGRMAEALPEHTLDTAAGFVASVALRPGETRSIAWICAAGATREAAIEAARPFRKYHRVRKIVADAGRAGAAALAKLGIPTFQAETFDALASLLTSRRDHASRDLRMNTAPLVGSLWKCGISGDRPVVLVSVFGLADLPIVRQMLLCHVYFVHKGMDADIIILNEHRGGYLKTLEDEIDFLLRLHRESGRTHANRMISIRADDFDKYEIERLRSVATVHIVAGEGSLAEQLRSLSRIKAATLPPPLAVDPGRKKGRFDADSRAWRPAIAGLELWNGFGGYDRSTREYVIAVTKGVFPPAPWSNIVAGEHAGFLATDRGTMFSWTRNSRDNKLTRAYNDPLSLETSEALYVRDDATGEWYSPLPAVGDRMAGYEIRHGEGYTEYRTHQGGLMLRLVVHVAPNAPVKYLSLSVKNDCGESRTFSAYGYFELMLGNFPHETKKHFAFALADGNSLIAHNAYRAAFAEGRVFLGIIGGADDLTTGKEEFIGRFGSLGQPAALARESLSSRIRPEGEPAAVLRRKGTVAPGEEKTVVFYMGEAPSTEELPALHASAATEAAARASLQQAVSSWRAYPKLSFDLPDRSLAVLCDRFLPYQTVASRMNARAGFYQVGGAFGFRDQLQDVLALLWHDPGTARSHILAAAAHQFREGDVLSWWHKHNDFGARTLLSDQQMWLPHAVARYVEFTGDARILEEEIPYLEGESPDAERRSVVGVFRAGQVRGTLYDHCVRAAEKGLTAGSHGLPLIGTADWNDSMNRVGSEGRGESVWLAWFNITVLRQMAGLARARGDDDRATRFQGEAERYLEAISRTAWDGNWFRRAFTDAGVPVGTRSAKSWRIDSISQSWATFTLGRTQQTETALLSAKQEYRIWEGSVPLAWPPSERELLDLGTLSDYPPGVRENAGQYNHAALWLAQAMFIAGDADAGRMILDAVNPFKRSETREKVAVYRGEPYAVAADVYSAPTFPGRAGWTWYTASSGVMYRTVVEYLLGLKVHGDTMRFEPSFPSDWDEATVRFARRSTAYVIRFSAAGGERPVTVMLDGALMDGPAIPLVDDGKAHEVSVRFVRTAKKA